MIEMPGDEPRRHHYEFGHWVLRFLAHQNPEDFVQLAERGDLAEALTRVWTTLGEKLPVDDRISPAGLATRSCECRGRTIVLVTMPSARYKTEAYFAALVVRGDELEHYIVLEFSRDLDGAPYTVLGEWTTDAHLNLGPGPDPDEFAFLVAVEARLAA